MSPVASLPSEPAEERGGHSTDVAIIGGGASGVLLALQLMHQGDARLRVTLVDRGPHPGYGIAYSTTCASHLLNTRAGDMSAWPAEPDHFSRWLQAFGADAGQDFACRQTYGRYLNAMLTGAVDRSDARLRVVIGDVASVTPREAKVVVEIAGRDPVVAHMAVLATGHYAPADDEGAYRGNPWRADVLDGLAPEAPVLLVGTGLTMIDIVSTLLERDHAGPITALSRRGLLPRMHSAKPHPIRGEAPDELFAGALSARLALFRGLVRAGRPWADLMQALRPRNAALWQSLNDEQQRRFLRHLRPWWDVHRHRVAPQIGAVIDDAIAGGQLRIMEGRLAAMEVEATRVTATIRRRGSDAPEHHDFGRVIDCRGSRTDISADSPLLAQLERGGHVRSDALQLGLAVDGDDAVISAGGIASPRLFALGPPTRGRHWEITAIPDIRKRAELLAARLLAGLPA
ncbi:FAD-dependent oxidoreductase [Bosea caraganae]|uniref:FAD-dependent oxidoreductase n=1 Tax=Bosea caraganae TaxID=2763117 RepID=A0A370L1S3_9HYPH|nr:FAD/NAD(P)-binding protein [Bosea caraganae]RDJ21310.1 FAD-dependent oxidoreductase [Bosea caraganae]RDJ26450.1 FAD-dependent oxidoreductase [Bosea caraganae]